MAPLTYTAIYGFKVFTHMGDVGEDYFAKKRRLYDEENAIYHKRMRHLAVAFLVLIGSAFVMSLTN